MMNKERVLVFLKPDAVIRRGVGARVVQEILNNEFEVNYFGEINPPREFIANRHYIQHRGKFFYNWLIKYVTSSPLILFILEQEKAIYKIRTLLGSTLPENADSNTIRGKFGILGGINVIHASDNIDNAKREVEIWKEIIKIKVQNCDYTQKADNYVRRYINFPIVDTEEYRKISLLLIDGKISIQKAKNSIVELLRIESDFDANTISRFADVIIENALLRKKEAV